MSLLEVKQITAGVGSKQILNNVTFQIQEGDFVAVCGPNGAGKSTLLSIIAGVAKKPVEFQGQVLLESIPVSDYKRKVLATKIAYMEQSEYSTWNFKVSDFVLQGRYAHSNGGHYGEEDYKVVIQVLEQLHITDLSERTVHTLSGGEFQKVRIARALAQNPKFLLLDEPAAGLDFVYEPQLLELLKTISESTGIGIILSMHDINMAARYCDKMILLPAQAAVISGTPDKVLNEENLKLTFGVDFERTDGRQLFQPRGTK